MIKIKCDRCHTISVIYDTPDHGVHKVCQSCGSPTHRVFDFSITDESGYPWYLILYVFFSPVFGMVGYYASRYMYTNVLASMGPMNSLVVLSVFWMTVVNLFGNYIKRGSSIIWNLAASVLAVGSTIVCGLFYEFIVLPFTSLFGIEVYISLSIYLLLLILFVIFVVVNLIDSRK